VQYVVKSRGTLIVVGAVFAYPPDKSTRYIRTRTCYDSTASWGVVR